MSPTYRYTAKNWEGKTHEGAHAAKNLREALDALRGQNLFVLQIKEQAEAQASSSFIAQWDERAKKKKAKSRDFMVFCRQFATMLRAGITVLQILKVQSVQAEHRGLQERLKEVALIVERGGTLTDAFEKHDKFFPRIMTAMIEAGEAGGLLDVSMERLADHFQKQHELEEKIRSATIYPVLVSGLAFLVMLLMVFVVLPSFGKMFDQMGFEMPFITRALIGVADTVLRYWYLVIGFLGISVVGTMRYIRTPRGRERFHRFLLKVPLFGPVYSKTLVARFARTLGTLLASGVQLVTSLELVERVINNVIFAAALDRTRQVIRQGQAMALPLSASGLFPPMLVEMVHVGEETGDLDGMLARTADFYDQEVAFVLDRLSSIIEPVLLIGVGLFVALLLVSMVSPMYKLYELI